jgi:hypothetical protein
MFFNEGIESYNLDTVVFTIVFIEILLILKKKDKRETKIFMIFLSLLQISIYYTAIKLNNIDTQLTKAIQDIDILLTTCPAEETLVI